MKRVLGTALLVLALAATACGGAAGEPAADEPNAAGTCLVGASDCDDVGSSSGDEPLFVDDEPTDGAPTDDVTGLVIGGGLTISEALSTDAIGVLAVQGFYVDDGTTVRLCELLAESLPPQCGEASIEVVDVDIEALDYQRQGGVTWTNEPVALFGEIVDGVFEVASNVSG